MTTTIQAAAAAKAAERAEWLSRAPFAVIAAENGDDSPATLLDFCAEQARYHAVRAADARTARTARKHRRAARRFAAEAEKIGLDTVAIRIGGVYYAADSASLFWLGRKAQPIILLR